MCIIYIHKKSNQARYIGYLDDWAQITKEEMPDMWIN